MNYSLNINSHTLSSYFYDFENLSLVMFAVIKWRNVLNGKDVILPDTKTKLHVPLTRASRSRTASLLWRVSLDKRMDSQLSRTAHAYSRIWPSSLGSPHMIRVFLRSCVLLARAVFDWQLWVFKGNNNAYTSTHLNMSPHSGEIEKAVSHLFIMWHYPILK